MLSLLFLFELSSQLLKMQQLQFIWQQRSQKQQLTPEQLQLEPQLEQQVEQHRLDELRPLDITSQQAYLGRMSGQIEQLMQKMRQLH